MVITKTDCPVCDNCETTKIVDYSTYVIINADRQITFPEGEAYSRCDRCGAVLHLPLKILPPEDFADYGRNYFYWNKDDIEMIERHAEPQQYNYDRFHDFIRENYFASEYPNWLDVGSVGYATSFNDYRFTTIEPFIPSVKYGKSRWCAERIHNSVIEIFETEDIFDGVVFLNSLYCTPTPATALARAHNLLREGGILVISIGHYFMGTKINSADGKYSHLEDVWLGPTMKVQFNPANLNALCGKIGFQPLKSLIMDNGGFHPHYQMRYLVFEKKNGATSPHQEAPNFEAGRKYTDQMLDVLVEDFLVRTKAALVAIDKPDTAIIGQDLMIREFKDIHLFKNAAHKVSASDLAENDGGVAVNDLATAILAGRIKTLVIATINNRDAFVNKLEIYLRHRSVSAKDVVWLVPSRQSGQDGIFGNFFGKRKVLRALEFIELDFPEKSENEDATTDHQRGSISQVLTKLCNFWGRIFI